MDFQIHVNLPYSHLGFLFIFYFLLCHTTLPQKIKRGAILFHEYNERRVYSMFHGEILDDELEEPKELEEQKESEELEEQKDSEELEEQLKEQVKFEDKYLVAFKSFSNEYNFTEEELQQQTDAFSKLKSEYQANKTKEFDRLNALLLETHKIIDLEPIFTDELESLIVAYFEIEDDYADNPASIDFDELFIYVENDHKRFQEEIIKLLEEQSLDAEFQDKALNVVLDKKLDGFMNNYILEFTPLGNVYMRYNHFKTSFEYFSNNTIPYRYLETIGRKYVMTFRCKSLFIDLEDELKKASEKDILEKEKEKEKEKDKEPSGQHFKSYNKDTKMDKNINKNKGRPGQNVLPPQIKANLPNVNGSSNGEKHLLKENANRYTWIGRLSNFPVLKKVDRKTVDKKYAMTFADFKQIKK